MHIQCLYEHTLLDKDPQSYTHPFKGSEAYLTLLSLILSEYIFLNIKSFLSYNIVIVLYILCYTLSAFLIFFHLIRYKSDLCPVVPSGGKQNAYVN